MNQTSDILTRTECLHDGEAICSVCKIAKKISRRCAMFPFNDPMSNGYVMDFLDTLHASFAMANFVYFTSFGCFLVKDKNKSLNFLN